MELLKHVSKHRTLFSEIVYVALNLALVAASLASVIATEKPYIALALVLLGKWRVLAVRPRYWFVNIQSNVVDVIAGFGFVVSMWLTDLLLVQIIISVIYAAWLLVIKPRSRQPYPSIQAGIALFIGINTVLAVGYGWPASVTVIFAWLIGFSAARHVLSHREEPQLTLYSLIWGFITAELTWAFYHWTIAYSLTSGGNLAVTQGAIIILLLSFAAIRVYTSYKNNTEQPSRRDVLPPVAFALTLSAVLLIFFNNIPTPLG